MEDVDHSRAVGKLFVVPAGALPVPVSDRLYFGAGRNRQIFSGQSRVYCRPRPAAQLLTMYALRTAMQKLRIVTLGISGERSLVS
jgi:hypothetical protein